MKIVNKLGLKIIIVGVMLAIVVAILMIAPNYIKDKNVNKLNLIINNKNVTARLKNDIFINENGTIYLSMEDARNYFDGQIYYDKENSQIITTLDTKVGVISTRENKIIINSSEKQLIDTVIRKDGTIYIPISEMGGVYNIETNKIKDTNIVTIESLDRELIKADVTKNVSVKYKAKVLSKTVEKLKSGDKVIYISENNGWAKIRTSKGKIGYIKADKLTNKIYVRQKMEQEKQIQGKVNLVWDYYSEYVSAPNRIGTSIEGINVVSPSFFSLKEGDTVKIIDNAERGGKEYIEWAKENGYKVWAMFSNNSMKETTSKILNNYYLRQEMIEKIVELAVKYKLDGINVDFEYMNMSDKDLYTRFIIELAPRLREYGIVTSVDVTAPDGSENWSLCFDRNTLAKVTDYIVFMAYDQYGISSTKPGTTAGYNWVEANVNKFLGQENIDPEKIILGMPLYTRLWKTDTSGKFTSTVVNMNKVDERIPDLIEKKWDDELKQYYVEYSDDSYTYQMWIEDAKSIKEKLNLINKYKLAGSAYWEKDRETQDIWTITKDALQ